MRTQNITFFFCPPLPLMTLDPGKAQVLSLLPRISKYLHLAKEKALHFCRSPRNLGSSSLNALAALGLLYRDAVCIYLAFHLFLENWCVSVYSIRPESRIISKPLLHYYKEISLLAMTTQENGKEGFPKRKNFLCLSHIGRYLKLTTYRL